MSKCKTTNQHTQSADELYASLAADLCKAGIRTDVAKVLQTKLFGSQGPNFSEEAFDELLALPEGPS
jgi:hypothetical protein